jgi:hypothetical protein
MDMDKNKGGRTRHSVRAVVVNQGTLVGKRRRARSDAPYLALG